MFEVRDLYVSYGKVKAVQGMTLTAEPGKVTLGGRRVRVDVVLVVVPRRAAEAPSEEFAGGRV